MTQLQNNPEFSGKVEKFSEQESIDSKTQETPKIKTEEVLLVDLLKNRDLYLAEVGRKMDAAMIRAESNNGTREVAAKQEIARKEKRDKARKEANKIS